MKLEELDGRAWAGTMIDDDPGGPDASAEAALDGLHLYPWPEWVRRLYARLLETAVWP